MFLFCQVIRVYHISPNKYHANFIIEAINIYGFETVIVMKKKYSAIY